MLSSKYVLIAFFAAAVSAAPSHKFGRRFNYEVRQAASASLDSAAPSASSGSEKPPFPPPGGKGPSGSASGSHPRPSDFKRLPICGSPEDTGAKSSGLPSASGVLSASGVSSALSPSGSATEGEILPRAEELNGNAFRDHARPSDIGGASKSSGFPHSKGPRPTCIPASKASGSASGQFPKFTGRPKHSGAPEGAPSSIIDSSPAGASATASKTGSSAEEPTALAKFRRELD